MQALTYEVVDDLSFAATFNRLGSFSEAFEVVHLGPFVELAYLSRLLPTLRPTAQASSGQARLPPVASSAGGSRLWLSDDRLTGIFRTKLNDPAEEAQWIRFGLAAQQAAKHAGFIGREPAQLVGALSEIYDNISEHAGTLEPGVVCFRSLPGGFEFVVSDAGRGILESLRTAPKYALLEDDADALRLALTEGVSRFDSPTRGRGFRPLFVGLAELKGALRFRSGAAALTLNGKLDLMTASLRQKAPYSGFHASVYCSPVRPPQ